MCKHQWQLLIPSSRVVKDNGGDWAGYYVEAILNNGVMSRTYFCPICGRTAHRINSGRSGMRLHHTDYFLNKANEVRNKYGLPELKQTTQ